MAVWGQVRAGGAVGVRDKGSLIRPESGYNRWGIELRTTKTLCCKNRRLGRKALEGKCGAWVGIRP